MLAKSALFVSFWQVHVLSETDDNVDDFRAAQVSIGLLGVVTEVTVRVKRKFHLEENRTHHTLTDCLKDLDELVHRSGYQYFKMWVEFYNDYCIRFQTRETDKQITGRPPRLISFLTVSCTAKLYIWYVYLMIDTSPHHNMNDLIPIHVPKNQ